MDNKGTIINIIIADDHPIFRQGLKKVLESEKKYSVVSETSNGEEALKNIRDIKPDVAILDIAMNLQVKELDIAFSRYSINSLKQQWTGTLRSQLLSWLKQSLVLKHAERTQGDAYTVFDASLAVLWNGFEFSVIGNNLFNETYSETNLVPMPKGNFLFGLTYQLR